MKKFQSLGRNLSKIEQKNVLGGTAPSESLAGHGCICTCSAHTVACNDCSSSQCFQAVNSLCGTSATCQATET
jgi:hypothetical protein